MFDNNRVGRAKRAAPWRARRRRGLAPLELVLALPMLLMILALICNFGNYACWKIRTESMARDAVWSTRFPRSGADNPRPAYWPANGASSSGSPANMPELDDPRVEQPVARGPLPTGGTVNSDMLDPTRGLRKGEASLSRYYPFMRKWAPFHMDAVTRILDDCWQYPRMGLSSNVQRRTKVLYNLQKAPSDLVSQYVNAIKAIYYAPFKPQLAPLDNDDEFVYYSDMFGWGSGAPNFYPSLQSFCGLEREPVDELVQQLVDRIQGKKEHGQWVVESLPQRVAQAFIGLYEHVIQECQSQIAAKPPLAAGKIAQMQALIDQMKGKINALSEYIKSL